MSAPESGAIDVIFIRASVHYEKSPEIRMHNIFYNPKEHFYKKLGELDLF